MSIASPADLLETLQRLHLLESAYLAELTALIDQGQTDARALARELVKRGRLTPFQVNEVFLGRSKELLLGSYVLLEKLGQGGMGAVYKARNWKLGNTVALKLIRKDHADREATIRRFAREIRASAQLDHPHIVKALDADEVEGTFLLVMEYVEGIDLAKLVQERGPLPCSVAIEFIRQAAIGLQHAHERGMVHRDIKPGNLILEERSQKTIGTEIVSTVADFDRARIKILDMGLALYHTGNETSETSVLTQEGFVMGSLDFMAPEQARDSHSVDIRADLYALGCTLYYLLTRRTPYPGGTPYQKMYHHQFDDPPSLEEDRPDAPAALSALIRKLMAKDPAQRCQTPAELIEVLSTITNPPSISTRPTTIQAAEEDKQDTAGSSTNAFAEMDSAKPKLPVVASRKRLMIALGCGVLGAGLLTWILAQTPNQPRDNPDSGATDNVRPTVPPTVQPTVQPTGPVEVQPSKVISEASPLTVRSVAYLADNKTLIAASNSRHLKSWNALTGESRGVLTETHGNCRQLALSPSGALMGLAHPNKQLAVWTLSTGAVRSLHRVDEAFISIAWSRDDRWLVGATTSGKVYVWDHGDDKIVNEWKAHPSDVLAVAVSTDGKRLLTCGAETSAKVWNLQTGELIGTLSDHISFVQRGGWSPDGKLIITGSYRTTRGARFHLKVWDADKLTLLQTIEEDGTGGTALVFSPNGKVFAHADLKTVVVRETHGERKVVARLLGSEARIWSLSWSRDGRALAAGIGNVKEPGAIVLWDVSANGLPIPANDRSK